jgi:hypothetical protein
MAGVDQDGASRKHEAESLAEVLASIRALVSAETAARLGPEDDSVLMLTPGMRVDRQAEARGVGLSEGLDSPGRAAGAPILDEESLRAVINAIVREELQGELGETISRNLRKLIRREINQALDERRES